MKTFSAKAHEVERDWYIVDASDKILGRLSTEIARRLRGKHKAIYTPHVDTGDYIIVINAKNIKVTGKKLSDKRYYSHSGYPGGIKSLTLKKLQEKDTTLAITYAVKGMLPKNSLGRAMLKKLKVYADSNHPHAAQEPKELKIEEKVDA